MSRSRTPPPDRSRWIDHLATVREADAVVEFRTGASPRKIVDGGAAVGVVACELAQLHDDAYLAAVGEFARGRAATVISATVEAGPRPSSLDQLRTALARVDVTPSFVGWASQQSQPAAAEALAIIEPYGRAPPRSAPAGFRVAAVIPAYNEVDIVVASIEALLREGMEVHIIDNWSTDGTFELASAMARSPPVTVERFPERPTPRFEWSSLLRRVEDVAARRRGWILFQSVDELRESPWPGVTLRDAFWWVGTQGFNAVDFSVATFHPVDDSFVPGNDFGSHFRWFEFPATAATLPHVAAWDAAAGRASLASSGGHDASFERRRVYPYRFLRKHYPIRSQAHGEQKVLVERVPRWDPDERARGWHVHYDEASKSRSFLRDRDGLARYDDDFADAYMTLRLLGPVETKAVGAWRRRLGGMTGQLRRTRANRT